MICHSDIDINAVKDSVKIEDIIEKLTGNKFKNNRMRCPFHAEKTASFFVNTKGQYYHCFGCGTGGDVIKFVQRFLNVDFKSAVNYITAGETPVLTATEAAKKNDERRKKEQFQKWENETFKMLYKAYHIGNAFLSYEKPVFSLDEVSGIYLYALNNINLLGYYIELITDNPILYYKNYRKDGEKIARRFISECSG